LDSKAINETEMKIWYGLPKRKDSKSFVQKDTQEILKAEQNYMPLRRMQCAAMYIFIADAK